MLSTSDIGELKQVRHALHRRPEVSGAEAQTAKTIEEHLRNLKADTIVTGLGGHGVAAVFRGVTAGPTLLFRCELDALPIEESPRPHQSEAPGIAHLCGHDGHMTILLGLARLLSRSRPTSGRVVLLFQPAEETGIGGPGVVADPRFGPLKPDFAFSLHNIPGLPFGYVGLTTGAVTAASRGMAVELSGHASHAAEPDAARSPRLALAHLMTALPDLSGSPDASENFAMITITHAHMGEATFGITPGEATLYATLRTGRDDTMAELMARAEDLVSDEARRHQLSHSITYHDVFAHTENDPEAVGIFKQALEDLNVPFGAEGGRIMPSEDFSAFTKIAPGAMCFLGAGRNLPPVHTPDYDWPDDLTQIGTHLFERVVRHQLG